MAKVSPRILQETITTAGYQHEQHGDIINIYTPTGSLTATGYLTQSGRLSLTSHRLRRKLTTLTELANALDELTELTK